MLNHENLIELRLRGDAIGEGGRIRLTHLQKLITDFRKALKRTKSVLQGNAVSNRPGHPTKESQTELAFDLVQLTHGSPVTVLGLNWALGQNDFVAQEKGIEILELSLLGLKSVQTDDPILPNGVDTGVLMAWRDLGLLLGQGLQKIEISLNHRKSPISVNYDMEGYRKIQNRIVAPQIDMKTIEGRLIMADFKVHGTRFRIHPSIGDPVICLFDDSQQDEVLENILQFVRVVGEATTDPLTGRITSIKISDIQGVDDKEDEQRYLIPTGIPVPMDFWSNMSIEELAQVQGIKRITNIQSLYGTWPGEIEDEFEELIETLRVPTVEGV